MSLGRSKEEQEMTSLLAKTLVERDVMGPMNAIGWQHGTPPPAGTTPDAGQPGAGGSTTTGGQATTVEGGQPAVKPGSAGDAPVKADTPEALEAAAKATFDPKTGKYNGKYLTVEEAIKGGSNLAQMANKALDERDQLAAKLAAIEAENLRLRQTPAPQAAPQAAPVPRVSRTQVDEAQANYDKVLSEIVEEGGLLDAEANKKLSKANRELADAIASYRVQENDASRESAQEAEDRKWGEVTRYMTENHPGSEQFSDEVALFVRSNTPLAKAIDALQKAGDQIGATELAWTSYKTASGAQVGAAKTEADTKREIELDARKEVREELKAEALKDAGVVRGSAGGTGVHQGGQQRGSFEERQALLNRMAVEGDSPGSASGAAYRKMVIPLPPGFYVQ